jgi:metallo-beta-lactamase family protein
MKITFLGAARTVTGSMYMLTVNGHQVLLECGLYEGSRQEAFERNRTFPFKPADVTAMVLSHAHIDHSGNIPALVRDGFDQSIFCTAATRDLCAAMLLDSGHIQESDAAYVNKKRARQGQPPVTPLYTQQDATRSLENFAAYGYHRRFGVAPGVSCTFYDAGHILGSAVVVLDLDENGRKVRLTFTGDLGRPNMPILRDPEPVPDTEVLIIESTYGNRRHESPDEAKTTLERVVNETYHRGGKVIIPAFAVGKTQDLIYNLHQLMLKQDIPSLPIYVDSPLAVNITDVFKLHPECYDAEITRFMNQHNDPFGFSRLYYIRQVEDSKALNFLREPAVIISASGMAETGRILHHLKNSIEDARNTVLIVGYQAENTLGRRIQEKRPTVSIFGEQYSLRASVEVITGYSAHADRDELLAYVRSIKGMALRQAFVVHGEEESAVTLARDLTALGVAQVTAPQRGDSVEL